MKKTHINPSQKYIDNPKMKKQVLFIALSALFLLTGCQSYKKVPYLQASEHLETAKMDPALYDARIMPKDLLTIVVSCTEPELAEPFNLTVATNFSASTGNRAIYSQPTLQNYLVDNKGNIDFPVLGTLHVGSLTKGEAEKMISEKLVPYLKDNVIVTVRMVNYKISVIGEVARPGTFTIVNEKVNVLEALAMAGDLTIYGIRENVKLIREDAEGHQRIVTLDLNDARLVVSPYYYLQQNDILYVTPNKAKAKNSDIGNSTTLWFSATSIIISLTSLLYNILK